jgi:phospholipid-binding lipoprotein MlaA
VAVISAGPFCRSMALVLLLLRSPGADAQGLSESDPIEPVNRAIFDVNDFLDQLLFEPFSRMYRAFLPGLVREGITNVLENAATPVILANDLFQGEWQRANTTFGRFMLNTITGAGGIIDTATWAGMPEGHYEDFGQTMAAHGVPSGPYLVLPILGPSNPRDAAGRVVDLLMNPTFWLLPTDASIAKSGVDAINYRSQNIETIDELRRTSLDFYTATRSLFLQLRAAEIRNGRPAPIEDIYDESIYDLGDDPESGNAN